MRIEGQLVARGSMEKSRLERRVREMLDVVSLGEFEARRPHQLSGGQSQRVARTSPKTPVARSLSAVRTRSTGCP